MRAYVLMSISAASLIAACASSPPDTLPTPDEKQLTAAEQYFTDNLAPVLERSCANCHADDKDAYYAPDFLGRGPVEDYYKSITTHPGSFLDCEIESSPLLLKGSDPSHPGASFATVDAPKVYQWLEMEAYARYGEPCSKLPDPVDPGTGGGGAGGEGGGEGGGPTAIPGWPPVTGAEHMKAFGDCSTYTDWVDAKMPLVANATATHQNNQVACKQCHNNPQTGLNHQPEPNNIADVKLSFKNMRYMWASFNLVRWTVNDDPGATFRDLVKSYLWRDTGITNTGHPKYTLNATYIGYYEDWYSRVRARYDEALLTGIPCDPALGNPPQ